MVKTQKPTFIVRNFGQFFKIKMRPGRRNTIPRWQFWLVKFRKKNPRFTKSGLFLKRKVYRRSKNMCPQWQFWVVKPLQKNNPFILLFPVIFIQYKVRLGRKDEQLQWQFWLGKPKKNQPFFMQIFTDFSSFKRGHTMQNLQPQWQT